MLNTFFALAPFWTFLLGAVSCLLLLNRRPRPTGNRAVIFLAAFSRDPKGRTSKDGPFSGQRFREEVLLPSLQWAAARNLTLIVNLDSVFGLASSWMQGAFQGLARQDGRPNRDVVRYLRFESVDSSLAREAHLLSRQDSNV